MAAQCSTPSAWPTGPILSVSLSLSSLQEVPGLTWPPCPRCPSYPEAGRVQRSIDERQARPDSLAPPADHSAGSPQLLSILWGSAEGWRGCIAAGKEGKSSPWHSGAGPALPAGPHDSPFRHLWFHRIPPWRRLVWAKDETRKSKTSSQFHLRTKTRSSCHWEKWQHLPPPLLGRRSDWHFFTSYSSMLILSALPRDRSHCQAPPQTAPTFLF